MKWLNIPISVCDLFFFCPSLSSYRRSKLAKLGNSRSALGFACCARTLCPTLSKLVLLPSTENCISISVSFMYTEAFLSYSGNMQTNIQTHTAFLALYIRLYISKLRKKTWTWYCVCARAQFWVNSASASNRFYFYNLFISISFFHILLSHL